MFKGILVSKNFSARTQLAGELKCRFIEDVFQIAIKFFELTLLPAGWTLFIFDMPGCNARLTSQNIAFFALFYIQGNAHTNCANPHWVYFFLTIYELAWV